MKNFKRKGDICISDKSLTAVWGQSQREEKLELQVVVVDHTCA